MEVLARNIVNWGNVTDFKSGIATTLFELVFTPQIGSVQASLWRYFSHKCVTIKVMLCLQLYVGSVSKPVKTTETKSEV